MNGPLRLIMALVTLITFMAGANFGRAVGQDNSRRYHCQSLGYEEFRVTNHGTIECVDVTREVVQP